MSQARKRPHMAFSQDRDASKASVCDATVYAMAGLSLVRCDTPSKDGLVEMEESEILPTA
jgi:hypothetical protein